MNTFLKSSKTFHWLLMLCLTLPFFYTGCEETKSEEVPPASVDSIMQVAPSQADTLAPAPLITDTPANKKEDKLVSQKIVRKFPFLKLILIPKHDTYSGLALLIDNLSYLYYYGIVLFWIFLSISLLLKYIDKNAFKSIMLFNILALLSLAIAEPVAFQFQRVWGFWLTLGLVAILNVLDFFIFFEELKRQKPDK